jgi:hypothetical protein
MSSVALSGIPVVPTDPAEPIPSGEVMPSEGVAVSGSSTCANAGLQPKRREAIAMVKKRFMEDYPI